MADIDTIARRCPRCGKGLAPDAAEGLCASCLLAAGFEPVTISSDEVITISSGAGTAGERDFPRLGPGDTWGAYRIGRLLGRGGMGEVYEAEHTPTGRRLALKLLRRRLQNAHDRARFFREGQLAASISHPHSVYIFGSEEISGMPAISMELLPGGTLKDRVASQGPLPQADAVAAVLDVISGLDAAQLAGILHRDIKPSNCFVDGEGAVKVGDFGLSISTLARDVRADAVPEGFEGTPQFAAPEQLRGEPLDVRADIYAVGATLYYLLTGRPPFDDRDLRELVTRVTHEPPASPRTLRPAISAGLASVVLQCLEKSPEQRPASYAALAEALRPYSGRDVEPARPGARVLAWFIDGVLLSVLFSIWRAASVNITYDAANRGADTFAPWTALLTFAYYAVLEGLWGASLGKRLLGLRIRLSVPRRWWWAIVARTAVFFVPNLILNAAILVTGPILQVSEPVFIAPNITLNMGDIRALIMGACTLVLTAGLFVAARRANGWAGLHDLISGTRVVSIRAREARRAAPGLAPANVDGGRAGSARRIGPYEIFPDTVGSSEHVVAAFDPLLRRSVWIRMLSPGAPPVSAAQRDISRTGRLHWLTGRRTPDEHWDAYEAPTGQPLLTRDTGAIEWSTLKLWLLDLANELSAATADGSLPILALDRLWVRNDGRLVLLDFPAPGLDSASRTELTPVGLLSAIVQLSPQFVSNAHAGASPLPLSGRTLIDRLTAPSLPSIEEARTSVLAAAASPERVSRLRRAVPMALAAAPMLVLIITAAIVFPTLGRFLNSRNAELLGWLDLLHNPNQEAGQRLSDPEIRNALEMYVAGEYADALRDDAFWQSRMMQGGLLSEWRKTAEQLLRSHPSVTSEALARAAAIVAPEIERTERRTRSRPREFLHGGVIIMTTLLMTAVMLVVGCGLISAIAAPGGVMTRMLGLAVVTGTGVEVGRARSLMRALVVWLPAVAWLIYLGLSPQIGGWVPTPAHPVASTALALGMLALGATLTIARPRRGPHDWVTGTWVVPR